MHVIYIGILILIIAFILEHILYVNNCDHEDFTVSNEAVQSVASVYNTKNMTVDNITATSKITTNDLSTTTFNLLPRGTIVMWTGAVAPAGWALCNGQNGTPDLRGRFVRMSSDDLGGFNVWGGNLLPEDQTVVTYDTTVAGTSRTDKRTWLLKHRLNDKGGTDNMALTLNEMPIHSHQVRIGGVDVLPADHADTVAEHHRSFEGTGGDDRVIRRRRSKDDAERGYRGVMAANAGSGWAHNNQPPYYVLSFIMKL
jgi:microcystin-dependent protein